MLSVSTFVLLRFKVLCMKEKAVGAMERGKFEGMGYVGNPSDIRLNIHICTVSSTVSVKRES